jgi:hypothetical protein
METLILLRVLAMVIGILGLVVLTKDGNARARK